MRTLYESILDDDVVTGSMDMPTLNDQYSISNITLENGDWSNILISRHFDWRKVQSYCKNHKYKYRTHWKVYDAYIDELVAIIENVPALGFEQNILGVFRMFLKKGYDVVLDDVMKLNNNNIHLEYILSKPGSTDPQDHLEFGIYLHKRK